MGTGKAHKEFNDQSISKRIDRSGTIHVEPLSRLKPTQFAVGVREVLEKQRLLREKKAADPAKLEEALLKKPILVVMGPGDIPYVVDHHHLASALQNEKYENVTVQVLKDFASCSEKHFWKQMHALNLLYLNDENGNPKPVQELPQTLAGLKDDPYRSLAWFVRTAGGYEKVTTPFAEFKWAKHFRSHIDPNLIAENFDKAVEEAMKLCQNHEARHLPGYIDPGAQRTANISSTKANGKKRAKTL